MKVKALLFDTRSIQRYIFSGNRLRTNIGASYIVDHLFDEVLAGILEERFPGCDCKSWEKAGKKDVITDLPAACTIGYIGGGKALVLFRQDAAGDGAALEQLMKSVVTQFTEQLLVCCPGLVTGVAIADLDLADYQAGMSDLFHALKQSQASFFPQVDVPYTGLTLTCKVNGEAANFYDAKHIVAPMTDTRALRKKDADIFFSQEVAMKAAAFADAQRQWETKFSRDMPDYAFPAELDKLGQKEGDNYLAVVHVDGNRMGVRFQGCRTLSGYRSLAVAVKRHTQHAFVQLLHKICGEYASYGDEITAAKDEKGRTFLPIRPLILGGDDITFVCHGKLALQYTKCFMEFMASAYAETQDDLPDGIDCCAGIAILPTAYPFFRGYELAEQLCDAAKAVSRDKPGTNWLDFALLHGEQAPTLDQIREQEYKGAFIKKLHFGPYQVGGPVLQAGLPQIDDLFQSLEAILGAIRNKKLAHTKAKELRYVLQRKEHDMAAFREQMEHLRQKLPVAKNWEKYAENLWAAEDDEKRTPYVDIVEMMEFYIAAGSGQNGQKE